GLRRAEQARVEVGRQRLRHVQQRDQLQRVPVLAVRSEAGDPSAYGLRRKLARWWLSQWLSDGSASGQRSLLRRAASARRGLAEFDEWIVLPVGRRQTGQSTGRFVEIRELLARLQHQSRLRRPTLLRESLR